MIKSRISGTHSILLGFLLLLNLASAPGQAAAFKTAFIGIVLIQADALSVNNATLLNPPAVRYVEGQNSSFRLFNGLSITNVSPEERIRVDLRSLDPVNFQPLDGAEFKSSGPISEDAINSAHYFTGNSSEVNTMLANLMVDWLDPLYENRNRVISAYFHNGSAFPTTSVLGGGALFLGTPINSPPYLRDGSFLKTNFDGGETDLQEIEGQIFALVIDKHDLDFNPNDPGIQNVQVTCKGADIVLGLARCTNPCDAGIEQAKGGMLSLQLPAGHDRVYNAPKCTIEFFDMDQARMNPRSSGKIELHISDFKIPLTDLQKIWVNQIKPALIGVGVGAPLSMMSVVGYYKQRRGQIDRTAAKVAAYLKLDIMRFSERTLDDQADEHSQGPEPVVGKWYQAEMGRKFQKFIGDILDEAKFLGADADTDNGAFLIAQEMKKNPRGIYVPSSGCVRRLCNPLLGKNKFKPNAVTSQKIQSIAQAVAQALSSPPREDRAEVELSVIGPQSHSRVELDAGPSSDQ